MKPVILITPSFDEASTKYQLSNYYAKAVLKSGGIPLIMPYENLDLIDEVIEKADGIILSGGGDIHAKFFNEELAKESSLINEQRDVFEIKLAKKALALDIPMLCICRGFQVLNVALGGNINQHIEGHVEEGNDDLSHEIKIVEDTYFSKIYKRNKFKVNSIHHQSVKNCTEDVEILAYADNIIEAYKIKDKKFVVGVQYHPERIYDNCDECKILFNEFIKYCEKNEAL